MATTILANNVINFAAAAKAIKARRKLASTARPFNGRLLRRAAMDPETLGSIRIAVLDGFCNGTTTQDVITRVLRDQVRAKARAAL